jgi:hypothetical protein
MMMTIGGAATIPLMTALQNKAFIGPRFAFRRRSARPPSAFP